MNNRILADLIVLVVGYVTIFLLGSFMSMSFNPIEWHMVIRIITGILSLMFTIRIITT